MDSSNYRFACVNPQTGEVTLDMEMKGKLSSFPWEKVAAKGGNYYVIDQAGNRIAQGYVTEYVQKDVRNAFRHINTAEKIVDEISAITAEHGIKDAYPYKIHGDTAEELMFSLDCAGIPYCTIKDQKAVENGVNDRFIIIDKSAYPIVKDKNEEILKSRGAYHIELRQTDMNRQINRSKEIDDKTIITLSGFSRDACTNFIKFSDNIAPGLALAVNKNDNDYEISIPSAILDEKKREMVAKAMLLSIVTDRNHQGDKNVSYEEQVAERKACDKLDQIILERIVDEEEVSNTEFFSSYKRMAVGLLTHKIETFDLSFNGNPDEKVMKESGEALHNIALASTKAKEPEKAQAKDPDRSRKHDL